MMELLETIEQVIREHIKVDATGPAPAIASAWIIGFDEAARAILCTISDAMEPQVARVEAYGFECEAGPLTNCKDWQELKVLFAPLSQEDDIR